MKVLIVDDNPMSMAIAKAHLIKEELEVLCVEDGKSSLEVAQQNKPDLILLDIDIPDISGFDICRLLKDDNELCMIPVIFLTAADDNENHIKGLDLGAVDYITKPFDAFELRARVRAALRTKQLQDQLTDEIIKHKQTESSLKESEDKFRSSNRELELLLSSIPSILIELTKDYKVIMWNASAEKSFGITESDVIEKPFRECDIQWDWDEIFNAISLCKKTNNSTWIDNFNYKRIDGKAGFLGVNINPIKNDVGEQGNILLLMTDITERKNMEQQLVHAQKLESIGELAAGIAHEINTPTQYIMDNTKFLQDAFSDINKILEKYSHLLGICKSDSVAPELTAEIDATVRELDKDFLVEEIPNAINQSLEGLDRVKNIVYAMKNFSHPDNENKKLIDINEAIKNTVTVARNEWKYVAEVKMDFDSSLTSVPCFPGDFNQVILNLIVNAAHAIGEVSGNGSEGKGTINISTRCDGEWAEIRVSDTGTGIPEEIRDRVFDQFFTTKEVGKGTGQGLSLVHSTVIGRHNGMIALDTELGKGTTFIIRLPLSSYFSDDVDS